MSSIYIAVTAHNPLKRVETTLETLRGYESLPLDKEIDIFIDSEHAYDLDEFSLIVSAHTKLGKVGFQVAPPQFTGYSLCWAHKETFKRIVLSGDFEYYVYSENDMRFTEKQFNYWIDYKDLLKAQNLEPGFCRVERYQGRMVPFDNYRKWNLDGVTKDCWGDIPYENQLILAVNNPDIVGFTSLGNPYGGLMILDQDQAETYIKSDSCDPNKSHALTGVRNWPIADRSSMGIAFEDLKPGQEHRRVVPVVRKEDKFVIPECALVEHMDVKYSADLFEKVGIIDTESMLTYGG